jgi:hypothetical protein
MITGKAKKPLNSFILQKTEYDCGPIAIFNALVWFDLQPNDKVYDRLFKLCKTDKEGTTTLDMNKALRWAAKKYDFSCEYKLQVTATEIVNHIKQGGSVVLGHSAPWEKRPTSHYSFWFDFEDNKVLGANVKWKQMYSYLTPLQLRQVSLNDDCWFLRKKEDE